MEDQYGMGNLRQFMNGARRPVFSSATTLPPPPPEQLLDAGHHYEMMLMMGRQSPSSSDMMHSRNGVQFHSSSPNFPAAGTTTSATCMFNGSLCGLEMEIDGLGGDGSSGRWPRQETLTLLEIRSRLDSMFKEANQKAPLWDEVSRIMSEEHGYQRSGKKCRQKFENLYKYYKKTKEGKAGRQDGKHYRFFRQLEALCGETSNPTSFTETLGIGSTFRYNAVNRSVQQHNQEAFQIQASRLSNSLTLSNSSGFDTSASEESDLNAVTLMESDSIEKIKRRRAGKRSLKAKIKDFIDAQMEKLMEKHEEWMEKIVKTIENKEQERILREEEWRRQEATRIDREHKLWAKERAWTEARDAAVMETLQKLTDKELKESEEIGVNDLRSLKSNQTDNGREAIISILKWDSWPECEITKLVQLRADMETSFQQIGCAEEVLWEEVAAKMCCAGYHRKGWMCKDKCNYINNYLMMYKNGDKKGIDNSTSCCYLKSINESVDSLGDQGMEKTRVSSSNDHHVASPTNTRKWNATQDSCFMYLMGDAQNSLQNYTLKLGNGENN